MNGGTRAAGAARRADGALGHPRVHLRRTDSTNERARALALAGAPHGTLVSAAEQTAGRGRQGRLWSAPAGSSVLASLVLRSPPALLPLIAAVAVCDAVGGRALIKWPNDVVVPAGGDAAGPPQAPRLAKLAGILIEGRPRLEGHGQEGWAVLGIGINVAVRLDELPAELRAGPLPAATLGMPPAAVEPTLAALLRSLERRLAQTSAQVLSAWRARDALRGRPVAWAGGCGSAEGVDGEGRLLVGLAGGGQVALSAGEVRLERLG